MISISKYKQHFMPAMPKILHLHQEYDIINTDIDLSLLSSNNLNTNIQITNNVNKNHESDEDNTPSLQEEEDKGLQDEEDNNNQGSILNKRVFNST